MTDIELLPCPFCGGRPYMQSDSDVDGCYWSKVRCGSCGVATRGKWASSSANTCPQWYAEVREEWNTRANVSHAAAAKDAEIERLRAEVSAVWNAMPSGARYLDPPDGGDVPLHEQVRRMAAVAVRAERLAEALRRQRGWWLASKGEAVSNAPGGLTRIDPGFIALCDAHVQQIDLALRDHDQEGKDG